MTMKNNHRLLLVSMLLVSGPLLTGCADLSTSPRWDASFGNSISQIVALQTLNPAGTAPEDADQGIDGNAAVNAQNNYMKSFAAPAKSGGASMLGGG